MNNNDWKSASGFDGYWYINFKDNDKYVITGTIIRKDNNSWSGLIEKIEKNCTDDFRKLMNKEFNGLEEAKQKMTDFYKNYIDSN